MIKKANDITPASVTGSSGAGSSVTIDAIPDDTPQGRRIRRSGAIQAAVVSPGVAAFSTNWEEFKQKVKELAEFELAFIEER